MLGFRSVGEHKNCRTQPLKDWCTRRLALRLQPPTHCLNGGKRFWIAARGPKESLHGEEPCCTRLRYCLTGAVAKQPAILSQMAADTLLCLRCFAALLCFAMPCFAILLCFALLSFALLCLALLCLASLRFALLCLAFLCFALLSFRFAWISFALLCIALLCFAFLYGNRDTGGIRRAFASA